jgi:hypothetical protein
VARQIWIETVATSEVDGPTLVAAAAASMLPAAAKYTFPADTFDVGKILRITASGRVSTVITTPGSIRFDVRLSNNIVFDSLALVLDGTAAYVNVGWYLELLLTCQSSGLFTAQFWGAGKFCCTNLAGQPPTPPNGALSSPLPATSPGLGGTFDSTIPNQLDLFFTQTVATGSFTMHQFAVELTN